MLFEHFLIDVSQRLPHRLRLGLIFKELFRGLREKVDRFLKHRFVKVLSFSLLGNILSLVESALGSKVDVSGRS